MILTGGSGRNQNQMLSGVKIQFIFLSGDYYMY